MGDARLGVEPERDGQLEELVINQNPSSEAPTRSKRRGSKGDVRGAAIARGVMEKSRFVRVIEWEEVRGDDPIEYFLLAGIGSTF